MPIRIVSPPLCPGFDMVRSVWFLPRLQLDFLACVNDLNGGGAEDFLHWAVPGDHAVLDAVEEKCRVAEGTACAVHAQIAPPVESMLFEAAGR